MKRVGSLLVFMVLLHGCGENIDLPDSPDLLVVEGWVTNHDTIQTVKLSRTVSFDTESSGQVVENAIVRVRSNNSIFNYHHTINGIFESNTSFAGEQNTEYWVEIIINGQVIRSESEKMRSVPSIDSLGYDYFEQPSEFNPQVLLLIYFPIVYVSDMIEVDNYYRWKFWKNDELFSEPADLYLQSDRFINGLDSIKNEFIDFNYRLNDTIKVEFQEISYDAYKYLRLLKLQTNSLGTRQGTTPAIVIGNLYAVDDPEQVVLGYFGVISTTTGEIIINP